MDAYGSDVGEELRGFFERLRDEGYRPALEAWIAELETDRQLSAEAAELLRAGNREEIERHLEGKAEDARPFIFWPPVGW